MVFSNNLLLGAVSAAAGDYLIEQSLLFNDDDSAYLTRTPSLAGNRKTWTLSCWVKRGALDAANKFQLFSATGNDWIAFSNDTVTLAGNGGAYSAVTDAVFRDSSAWYHVVVAADTTQATSADRVKIYVNGTQFSATISNITQNMDFVYFNSAILHSIGVIGSGGSQYFDGLMALPIFVDGVALAPTAFGETDDDGFWNPIEYVPSTISDPGGVTYVSNASSTANATGYTFSGQAIGTANANRQVIVGTSAQRSTGSPQATPTVTIGGVSATEVVGKASTDALYAALFVANVPSGTTADIVVTWPQSSNSCDIGVWAINTANFYVRDIISSNASPGTDTLSNMSGDGFVVAYCGWNTASADVTWVGATEDFDISNAESANASGASSSITSDSDLTITATYSATNSNRAMVAFAVGSYDGIGTNGFQLDYADTTFFGKNVSGADDQAALSSAAPAATAWLNITGAWTMGSGTASRTTTVNAIRSASVFTGDFSLALTMASGATAARLGVYAANEDSTFVSSGADSAGMDSMTNSFYANFGAGNFYKGSSTTASVSQTNGAITITRVSGTITINTAGGNHTFSATYTGPMRFVLAGGGATMSFTGIAYTSDGQAGNSYFDTNFTASDQLEDSPTDSSDDGIGNFATLNPNDNGGGTLSQGNRYFTSAADKSIRATMSGTEKYQIECFGKNEMMFGLASAACPLTGGNHYNNANSFMYYGYNGNKVNTSFSSYGSASTTDSTYVGMTYDPSNGDLRFYLNGTDQGTAFTMDTSVEWYPYIFGGSASQYLLMNFGQTAFEHPISGFTPLATQNLPAPTIADGSQYFNTVLYTGNGTAIGSGGNAITGVGFQPDFVWIKDRGNVVSHVAFDSVRGTNGQLYPDLTNAEATGSIQTLDSFDADGFTLGSASAVNGNTYNFVAWCWKAGGAAVSNTDGSITSSVSANTTSGFSIVSYTGTGASYPTPTIGHGLGLAPKFYIIKNRDQTDGWAAFHEDMNANPWNDRHLRLDTNAAVSGANNVSGAAPTSSIIYLDSDPLVNASSENYICYAWAEVEGFSKFGSYTGNGSADGPFVYTGFRPAYLLVKRTDSTGNWILIDSQRDTFNVCDAILTPDDSQAEVTADTWDLLSNGFKLRSTSPNRNASGGTYIYAAYAEHPFQGDDGITQARAR